MNGPLPRLNGFSKVLPGSGDFMFCFCHEGGINR